MRREAIHFEITNTTQRTQIRITWVPNTITAWHLRVRTTVYLCTFNIPPQASYSKILAIRYNNPSQTLMFGFDFHHPQSLAHNHSRALVEVYLPGSHLHNLTSLTDKPLTTLKSEQP